MRCYPKHMGIIDMVQTVFPKLSDNREVITSIQKALFKQDTMVHTHTEPRGKSHKSCTAFITRLLGGMTTL